MDVMVRAGAAGAYLAERGGEGVIHVSVPQVRRVVDTTGAGDVFIGAFATRLREGDRLSVATEFAVRAARFSVASPETIPAFAGPETLQLTLVERGA
jgi:ribokinase